jgi:hypothetical protein
MATCLEANGVAKNKTFSPAVIAAAVQVQNLPVRLLTDELYSVL